MKEWRAHALRDRSPLGAQAIRAFKGNCGRKAMVFAGTKRSTCKDLGRDSCTHSAPVCFSHRCPLGALGQDGWGSAKSAFCIFSDPEAQKIGPPLCDYKLLGDA